MKRILEDGNQITINNDHFHKLKLTDYIQQAVDQDIKSESDHSYNCFHTFDQHCQYDQK